MSNGKAQSSNEKPLSTRERGFFEKTADFLSALLS